MGKRPFLLLACMFLAGILTWRYQAWQLLLLFALSLCITAKTESGKRRWLLLGLMVVFFVAGALRTGGEEEFRKRYLPKLQDGQELRLLGEITRIEEKSRCVYLYLTDCMMDVPCNDVLAYVPEGEYCVGQQLVVRGSVRLFEEAANEGGFDERAFYQSQRIDFGLWVTSVEQVCGEGGRWLRLLFTLRERLKESIAVCGGTDGILSAMLLGEKSGLDSATKELYQNAGISHILAISGLHVSLLGLGLYRLLRLMLGRAGAGGLTALFLALYGVMTGESVSCRRAIGMLFVMLVADVLGRGYDMLSALGLLCIVLLWENPFLTGYSGFQLSVAAVLGVGIGQTLESRVLEPESGEPPEWDGQKAGWRRKLSGQLLVSLGIQLATLPLVLCLNYELPVYALLFNLVVLALVKYLLVSGCCAAVLGLWSVKLGTLFMTPCNWILGLYEALCRRTLTWPLAQLITGCPRPWQLCLYYSGLALGLYAVCKHPGQNRFKGRGRMGQGMLSAAFFLLLPSIFLFRPAEGLRIDVLDVGQGDGICICTEDHTAMFIDGGSTDVSQVGSRRILPFLKYNGVRKISYWFVSHTDEDHISGLTEVLEGGYPLEYLVFAEAVRREEKTLALAELAGARGVQVLYMREGDTLSSPSLTLRCLSPGGTGRKEGWSSKEEGVDLNGLSLVLLLETEDFSGIFTGDITEKEERALLDAGLCTPVDFYKAAHHGSKYSGSEEFLQALSPTVSVISCGKHNRYGHPAEEAVCRIGETGSKIYYTMYSGQLSIRILDGAWRVEEKRKKSF
ncbi:MAG: DNA internalization-related competence protein ComEC/Rec2 [Muribaculaceae bacterium]|nr:DNA internalization-related competence protein ComEC/Rec2 [Roseburia sp.]MCM1431134.1 DNA internalization-related competence protein ComEC/Rec2 [Muribaculaceae bacterium]MCM1492557.1 DNA internalization-related competence protein ComEC/Rec2 [Muribaculaceae bacterium]